MSAQRGNGSVRSRASVAALVLILTAGGAAIGPGAAAADPVAPPPTLFVGDAPFVRHPLVQLGVMQQGGYGGPVAERRVSNDSTVVDGVLVNGLAVAELGPWNLAAGPDGPRNVYAQMHYASGLWSTVSTLNLVLDRSPASSLHLDMDPQPGLGYEIHLPPGSDWHTRTTTTDTPISGRAILSDGSPTGFRVGDGTWTVYFENQGGPVGPGIYSVSQPVEEVSCGPVCAGVIASNATDCAGSGTFTIHEIEFTADGDLAAVAADFRLTCFSSLMSGSIRYGSSRDTVALDQSGDALTYGSAGIGAPTAPLAVTFTNFGTVATDLGEAAVSMPDFAITTDTCSDETLGVGETCQVAIRFSPQGLGNRVADLTIPDETVRGSRFVRLVGAGFNPTSLSLATPGLPTFGPAPTTIVVTITPDAGSPVLFVDGVQQFGPTDTLLSSPVRRAFTYTPTLAPGAHTATATFAGAGFYLGSTAGPLEFEVGTKTFLVLSTAGSNGAIAGEPAELVATLWPGAALSGGILRIRDGVTGAILASASVSGSNPTLSHTVLAALGTHPYTAEFVPASPDVQAASAEFDLVAVAGTRPETVMASSTLNTMSGTVQSAFSSPDAGVTFECRVDVSDWFVCTSPATFNAAAGVHEISVRARSADGLADSTPATRTWIVDGQVPSGAIVVAGGAATTRTATVSVNVTATDAGGGVTEVALSNDGVSWTTRVYAATQSWTLAAGSGLRTVHARWKDAGGNWSQASTDTIVLDAVLPTASAPSRAFVTGSTLSGGKVPMRLAWSGADATSGIARYELLQSTDGAAWASVSTTLTTATLSRPLAAGHTYRFCVRAVDKAGNIGAWAYGGTFRLSGYQEANSSLKYAGRWATSTNGIWWGGKAKASSSAGASVKLTFTGRSVAWVGLTSKTRGRAQIYINGILKATVDLYAPTTQAQRIVWTADWSSSATRTITIRVVGTSGRPRIDIDAILVGT